MVCFLRAWLPLVALLQAVVIQAASLALVQPIHTVHIRPLLLFLLALSPVTTRLSAFDF